jgi:hypothetical protein
MPESIDVQIDQALSLLPATGEIEFDQYKANLYAQNPDGGKAVFTAIIKGKMANRRLDMSTGKPVVFLARKSE